MKYFITGATGFLGGRMAHLLREKGHDVVALVRNPEKAEKLKRIGVETAVGDITDKESMRAPMERCDAVYHMAAWYKVGVRDRSPAQKINVEGTRNVLELMQELKIKKGVYTSSLAANSDTKGEIKDESYRFTGKHLSEYDRTKAEAHHLADRFIDEGLPLVIVMPGVIYGPDGTSMSDESLRLYLKKKLPVIPKRSAFCWAHVEDTTEAHYLAMERAKAGSTYIIAGPVHTLTEVFTLAEEITGIRSPMPIPPALPKVSAALASLIHPIIPLPDMYSPESLRVQAGATYLGDNSRAKKDLGYDPRPLREGLTETLRYELEQIRMQDK